MKPLLAICENGLHVRVHLDEKNRPRLTHFSAHAASTAEPPTLANDPFQFVQIQGEQAHGRFYGALGARRNLSQPGFDFVYRSHTDNKNVIGRKIEWLLSYEKLEATVHWQFYEGIPVLRSWVEVTNRGTETQGLEMVASFYCGDISHGGKKPIRERSRVHYCLNAWLLEMQWQQRTLHDLNLSIPHDTATTRFVLSNTGSWSTKEFLPLGLYENTETNEILFWQIENNGSWSWELGDAGRQLYLMLGGPNEPDHHWFHRLEPGASFTSVPAAVGWAKGSFDEAMGALTRYRRALRRPHWDNEKLPVIFNDYMNCLFADPTTEKELPLIEAAAGCGAEIYVIDAGWYAKRGVNWWDSVGEWQPSQDRFEGGIQNILKTIREHGMIPGLWLELEVIGVACSLAKKWPDDCFFLRHGKRINCRGRYQLDFRHPTVIAHANEVVDRLVTEYGVGYIKMDYNIDVGIGTEVKADSFGDGLLKHNRAYLAWLESIFTRYPKLIVENCSSGGMRIDYGLLALHSIQSTSDQEDYRLTGIIAAAAASGAPPEQQAVWSYPKREGDKEEAIFNLVNALLNRVHQSGHIADLSPERRALVKEGIAVYKKIRADLAESLPFWPTGLPHFHETFFTSGRKKGKTVYLAAWKVKDSRRAFQIPLPEWRGHAIEARCIYPKNGATTVWNTREGILTVGITAPVCARLFELKFKV